MQYIKKDLGAFNLHMIKTEKFKTITMRIVFHSPIKKDEITKRNVLSDVLLQSTSKYSSKRSMIIEAEDLYAADIYNNTHRIGNYVMTSFILQVLNDKYTEEGNFEKAVEFMNEILFHPDIKNNCFKRDKLDVVKKNCEVSLSSIKEDPVDYSIIRLKEAYDKDSPVSYRMIGYMEDLENINESNLYLYYKKMIEDDFVDIYVVGDFNEEDLLRIIKNNFKFRKIKKKKIKLEVEHKEIRKRRLIAKEKCDNSQSKLGIICPTLKMKDYEKNYPMVLANIIFGGGIDSKLFSEIREKNSLCYSIYSVYSKLDNLMMIWAGIDRDNFDKTVELTTNILEKLKKGKFTEKDVKVAKEFYSSSITSIEESPMNIIREILTEEMTGIEPYYERVEKMNKVKKSEIVRALKKIKMDTIFLLEGEEDEGN
ncbi:MAG: insulinase family protein [Bacilli bacterium]|nr:insulinase family protein [Bacilli bacterium]MBR6137747.1 insulinase family protein [Bacilli bacterium]